MKERTIITRRNCLFTIVKKIFLRSDKAIMIVHCSINGNPEKVKYRSQTI